MKAAVGLIAAALAFAPSAAQAQGFINLQLGFPGPPPLFEVQPGIQVVEGVGEEVFFSGGWYWCRRANGWYRAPNLGARFDWVEGRYVPGTLRGFPVGRYRNWHREGWRGDARRGEVRGAERREVRHEEIRRDKAVERHEERREEKRDEHHH